MSTFQEKLDEFYLNYDTVCLLKEDSQTSEIVDMFKAELNYPENLTTALLKFNKTFLKSVIMRIKVRQQKIGSIELKDDLLKYNTDLEPILDKLLSENFIKQYQEVIKEEKKVEKVEKVEKVNVEVDDDDIDNDDIDNDIDDEVYDEVDDNDNANADAEEDELSEEDVVDKFLNKFIEKSDKGMLSLVDMYESYTTFCNSSKYELMQPLLFKKYVRTTMGKPDGKGDKSIYKGYKLIV